jgi:uncharacterized protein
MQEALHKRMHEANAAAWILGVATVVCGAVTALSAAVPAAEPSQMGTVYLVLLKKGPAWTATETAETRAIQEGHMANIRALWAAKKLIVAGPLGDNGETRGVFVFQVGTLEEATSLTRSDPAVKAGRLVAEIHPWWVEKRALPSAGSYCQPVAP